jgi:hypothetical protein
MPHRTGAAWRRRRGRVRCSMASGSPAHRSSTAGSSWSAPSSWDEVRGHRSSGQPLDVWWARRGAAAETGALARRPPARRGGDARVDGGGRRPRASHRRSRTLRCVRAAPRRRDRRSARGGDRALAADLRAGGPAVVGTVDAGTAPTPSPSRRPRARPRRADLIGRADELARLEAMVTEVGRRRRHARRARWHGQDPVGAGRGGARCDPASATAARWPSSPRQPTRRRRSGPIADALGIRLAPGVDARAQLKDCSRTATCSSARQRRAGRRDRGVRRRRAAGGAARRVAADLAAADRGRGRGASSSSARSRSPDEDQGSALAAVPAMALLLRRARDAGVARRPGTRKVPRCGA